LGWFGTSQSADLALFPEAPILDALTPKTVRV